MFRGGAVLPSVSLGVSPEMGPSRAALCASRVFQTWGEYLGHDDGQTAQGWWKSRQSSHLLLLKETSRMFLQPLGDEDVVT